MISFLIATAIILLLLLPERNLYRDSNRSNFGQSVKWVFLGIVLVYFTQIAAGIIDQLVFKASSESKNTESIMELASISPYVLLIIVIVGPILEEIVFRKIIFGQLARKTKFWIGAIISSLVFALAHADGHLIIYGSMGLVLCFLYWKTRRIVIPMIAHGTMNALAVLVSFSPAIQKMIEEEQHRQHLQFIAGFLIN
ncbi:MAG: CPBP family intramembrane glutamic endopeptidase [Tuberibacillus sp.]